VKDRSQLRLERAIDKRVERLYYKHCSGIQIDIMDIGKVFNIGRMVVAAQPQITDDDLAHAISSFVGTIRRR
jgi:hypothetical protein